MRRFVRSTAARIGREGDLERVGLALHSLRQGKKWRQGQRDDERVKLVAAAVLRDGSNCIDIGANEGKLLEVFTGLAPHGRHIAYEPIPALADDLGARFPDVEIRRAAVSDEAGETSFVVHKSLASRSSMRSVGYSDEETETLTVAVETLDGSLGDYAPDLIKIDVEGAEHLALEGARETLRRHGPIVLFEHQQETASHYGVGPDRIFGLLTGVGYRIFDMEGDGPYTEADFRTAYEEGTRFNFLASPGVT